MPSAEGEVTQDFTVDFYNYTDSEKFELIEHIIHGDTVDIEGSATVEVEFDLSDYAPEN